MLAESELREEFTTAFILFETYRAKGVEALFTRLGEEAVIGAVFASFHSFLSSGRSVTERFCVEEINDAISALGGITAVGALIGAFSSVSERTLSKQGKSLSFLKLDSQ